MKKIYLAIVEFFMSLVAYFKHNEMEVANVKVNPTEAMRITNPLPMIQPDTRMFISTGSRMYFPKKTKFKPSMREQHLGRRRSRFYFNKNR